MGRGENLSARRGSWWKRTRRRLAAGLAGALGPWLLRALAATWRVRRVRPEALSGACVFALWHENIPAGAALHGHVPISVLISRHHDGELITRIVRRLGYRVARGSTYDGSVQALRDMLREARDHRSLVVTPDGPRGPRRSVAPGVLYLAAATGRPLLASGFAASRSWRARSWDRMMIPKPFARVVVAYGPALALARAELDDAGALARRRAELGAAMDAAQRAAEEAL